VGKSLAGKGGQREGGGPVSQVREIYIERRYHCRGSQETIKKEYIRGRNRGRIHSYCRKGAIQKRNRQWRVRGKAGKKKEKHQRRFSGGALSNCDGGRKRSEGGGTIKITRKRKKGRCPPRSISDLGRGKGRGAYEGA